MCESYQQGETRKASFFLSYKERRMQWRGAAHEENVETIKSLDNEYST